MADELRIGLSGLLRKARMEHDADFLKEGVRLLCQALMEMEVEEHIGASPHERTDTRTGHRNGYRQRCWDTRVGTVELEVPRVRETAATFRPCSIPAGGQSGHSARSFRKRTCTASLDSQGRRAGEGPRDGWHLQESQVSRLCEEINAAEVEPFP
jgi:putative transposase